MLDVAWQRLSGDWSVGLSAINAFTGYGRLFVFCFCFEQVFCLEEGGHCWSGGIERW